MPKSDKTRPSDRDARRRRPNPLHKDNYPHSEKEGAALQCPECGLAWFGGRWYHGAPAVTDVRERLCPACKRIRDGYPAGTIQLPADLLEDREELVRMIRNAETAENAEHPLERIMDIAAGAEGSLVITTTGVHLARRIANKIERRVHRQARFNYSDGDASLRVHWGADDQR